MAFASKGLVDGHISRDPNDPPRNDGASHAHPTGSCFADNVRSVAIVAFGHGFHPQDRRYRHDQRGEPGRLVNRMRPGEECERWASASALMQICQTGLDLGAGTPEIWLIT
jgi:hypothetical protein